MKQSKTTLKSLKIQLPWRAVWWRCMEKRHEEPPCCAILVPAGFYALLLSLAMSMPLSCPANFLLTQ
jgi:hypothetical protein